MRRYVAVAVGSLVVASALIGCSPEQELAAKTPLPTVSEVSEPSQTPQADPADQYRDRAKELFDMSWDEFKVLERSEQLLLIDSLLQKPYNETAQKNGDVYLELFNPRDVAAVDNDAASILNQHWYLRQVVLSQRAGDGTTNTLDHDRAHKAMAGTWYYTAGKGTNVSGEYDYLWNYVENNESVVESTDRFTAVSETELQKGTDRDGNEVTYKDIVYTTDQGMSIKSRFVYTTYTGTDGKEHGIWQDAHSLMADSPVDLSMNW